METKMKMENITARTSSPARQGRIDAGFLSLSRGVISREGVVCSPRLFAGWYAVSKRLFDIVCASIGLLVLAPVGLLIALLVKLSDGGPVFYRQTRIGQFGKPFRVWKFRSMAVNADTINEPLTKDEDPRFTSIGRFLRKTKLNELPQLWNVLIGDMSFVGPRPELPRYVERYTPEQREILKYKPGITELATLHFRNEEALLRGAADVDDFYIRLCLPRKIALNLQYARHASLPYDIWIMVQTMCPYWLGVLALYAAILVASLWFSFELCFDFHVPEPQRVNFWVCLPWMVLPQLFILFWRKQCRALVSYFSLIELRQTGLALGIAFLIHLGVRYSSHGIYAPVPAIIVMHLVLSLCAISEARLFLKFVRERQGAKKSAEPDARRVAIIGSGELGTRVALDLISREVPKEVVAFFDDDPRLWNRRPYDIPVVGMPECLLNTEWRNNIDEVIVALPEDNAMRIQEICKMLKGLPSKVTIAFGWPVVMVFQEQVNGSNGGNGLGNRRVGIIGAGDAGHGPGADSGLISTHPKPGLIA
jgi:lipopolysaccharide/colanic/teichoic acid biosynthesis glycosyltransferase